MMSLIPINWAKVTHIDHTGAFQFIGWVQDRDAQINIRYFGKDKFGEPLFFPNSPEGEKL